MRIVPHSYPWCNLEGVKTATVEKEQGSAKQTLHKQKYSAQPASLLLNPRGRKSSQSMEHFHNSVHISDAAVMQGKNSFIAFQEESKDSPSLNKTGKESIPRNNIVLSEFSIFF